MDNFIKAYLAAALWSSTDDNEKPLDANYTAANIAPETLEQMKADCAKFQAENAEDIAADLEQAGHDFLLTRQHAGSGYWDGDWPEPAATASPPPPTNLESSPCTSVMTAFSTVVGAKFPAAAPGPELPCAW